MNPLEVLVLAIVEGITEFLPISSTGHMILAGKLMNMPQNDFLKTFQIVVQLGAILAVVVLYFRKIITNLSLIKKITLAFLPSAVVGFTLYPLIKTTLLGNSAITLNALFFGGLALIGIEWFLKKSPREVKNSESVTYKQALVIGTFQSLSIIPGVSRSAATITGGLLTGLNRETATEFSFLLAIPTMFAATSLDLWKSRDLITQGWTITLLAGTTLSFIFAILAIKFLVGYVKKHDFTIFGVYRILLALAFWLIT